jgi:hypothetical protein
MFVFVVVACVADTVRKEDQPRKPTSCFGSPACACFLLEANGDFCVDRIVSDWNVNWHCGGALSLFLF